MCGSIPVHVVAWRGESYKLIVSNGWYILITREKIIEKYPNFISSKNKVTLKCINKEQFLSLKLAFKVKLNLPMG